MVWDKLFGTFQSERGAGKIDYGVTTPPVKPLNPLYIQLHDLCSQNYAIYFKTKTQ